MPEIETSLMLTDQRDARDLDQFLTRAAGIRDGVVRLVARRGVLAVHVAAAFPLMLGGAGPTLVAQRGLRLAQPAELDVVVPIAEVRDRLARLARQDAAAPMELTVPPSRPSAPWTATVPLAAAWSQVGEPMDDALAATARQVAQAVQDALPESPGQPLVFQAREALWGAERPELGQGVVAGAAFLAHAYGFLAPGGRSALYSSGAWNRLSSRGGTMLWRAA